MVKWLSEEKKGSYVYRETTQRDRVLLKSVHPTPVQLTEAPDGQLKLVMDATARSCIVDYAASAKKHR